MVDFQIPDFEVMVERRESRQKALYDSSVFQIVVFFFSIEGEFQRSKRKGQAKLTTFSEIAASSQS